MKKADMPSHFDAGVLPIGYLAIAISGIYSPCPDEVLLFICHDSTNVYEGLPNLNPSMWCLR